MNINCILVSFVWTRTNSTTKSGYDWPTTILDPPFWIPELRVSICIQRLEKKSKNFVSSESSNLYILVSVLDLPFSASKF